MEDFLTRHYRLLFTLCMAAIVILAFHVGMLEGKRAGESAVQLRCSDTFLTAQAIPRVEADAATSAGIATSSVTPIRAGAYAGSKNGTKYYTPGCAGLNRIKPENLIWFKDKEDATLQGYSAGSC